METKTHKEEMAEMKEYTKALRAEIKAMRELRTEKNRPTVWINKDWTRIEIHFENKTVLARIDGIDRETSRECSDDMAKGSSYRQIPFKKEEDK